MPEFHCSDLTLAVDRSPTIGQAEVERFDRDGFLAIEQLAEPRALTELAQIYNDILERKLDCSRTDELLGRVTRQIMFPDRYHPIFKENEAYLRGREVAALLLGVEEPVPVFQMGAVSLTRTCLHFEGLRAVVGRGFECVRSRISVTGSRRISSAMRFGSISVSP